MVKLACKDINPETNCTFEVRGNTPADVTKKMMTHLKSDHAESVDDMGMNDEDLEVFVEAKVHA